MEGKEYKDLEAWLERNRETFTQGYSIDDVANLAIACGFNRQAVAQWQTNRRFKEAI